MNTLLVLLSYILARVHARMPPFHQEQRPLQVPTPSFYVHITPIPRLDLAQDPIFLDVKYIIDDRSLRRHDTIFTIPLELGNVPTQVDSLIQSMTFSDDWGDIPVIVRESDIKNELSWTASRDCHGTLTARFTVYPRNLTEDTPSGARIDLRPQTGGLMGAGVSFLPLPPQHKTKMYAIKVNCDTARVGPDGTCVSSFSQDTTAYPGMPASVVATSVFAAGNLTTYSAAAAFDDLGRKFNSSFKCAWFERPPFDVEKLCESSSAFYMDLETLFGKPASHYHLFFRRGIDGHGSGGTAFSQTSIVEYDAAAESTFEDYFHIVAHEMIHNWPLMTECSSRNILDNVLWFTEGKRLTTLVAGLS